MTGESRVTMRKGTAAFIALALLVIGGGASYFLVERAADNRAGMPPTPSGAEGGAVPSSVPPPVATAAPSTAPLPDIVVSLPAEAIERAGIVVAPVSSGESALGIRLPGVVEPNAYRQVAVTSLVTGRVTHVSAALGDRVRRGQTLAQIYSPELAEAQTRYVSAKTMLDAHDRELQRTQKLAEIGAASRQELERIHAEHAAQTAAVQSTRSQLELLGVPTSTIDGLGAGSHLNATTSVPAPMDGVVTTRAANVGLNVDQATTLFTVADLSTVWIVADVYEKDFSRVHVGSDTTVTTAAYPELQLRAPISYIDPQVAPETRTAKVRVEVPDVRSELRLGMYVDVMVAGTTGRAVHGVPRSAVQNVGNRTVIYLVHPTEPGKFTEREVRLGEAVGEQVEIVSGVQPGDVVVTEGSFFVRAERERLGLRPVAAGGAVGPATPANNESVSANVQSTRIVINERGFEPAKVTLPVGVPARLTFIRTTDKTCATEVVVPSLDVKRALPLNEPVDIEFTPARTGEVAFACGMNMLKGVVVVE